MKVAQRAPEAAALDRMLDPLTRSLTPAAVRALVAFRADAATQARVADLAERCNEGRLAPEERREYEAYVRAIDLIAVLQSKARQLIANNRKS